MNLDFAAAMKHATATPARCIRRIMLEYTKIELSNDDRACGALKDNEVSRVFPILGLATVVELTQVH